MNNDRWAGWWNNNALHENDWCIQTDSHHLTWVFIRETAIDRLMTATGWCPAWPALSDEQLIRQLGNLTCSALRNPFLSVWVVFKRINLRNLTRQQPLLSPASPGFPTLAILINISRNIFGKIFYFLDFVLSKIEKSYTPKEAQRNISGSL